MVWSVRFVSVEDVEKMNKATKELWTERNAMRQCAKDRLAEISGETLTYEDAFRKLEIACAALSFIAEMGTELKGW